MKIYDYINITSQEIPWLLHTSFMVAGCTRNCPNCSWNDTKNKTEPYELNEQLYRTILDKNKVLTEAVVFLGGEWDKENLINFLRIALEEYHLKTCLYTGAESLNEVGYDILNWLDYVKTGRYDESLGPLSSKTTNQRFIDVSTGECFNHKFQE